MVSKNVQLFLFSQEYFYHDSVSVKSIIVHLHRGLIYIKSKQNSMYISSLFVGEEGHIYLGIVSFDTAWQICEFGYFWHFCVQSCNF